MCQEKKRELTSIHNYADALIQGLEDYIKKSRKESNTEANNRINNVNIDRKKKKKKKKKTRQQKWKKNVSMDISRDKTGKFAHKKAGI